MKKFENCLALLNIIGRIGIRRSALERHLRGFFIDKLDFYVQCGIIRVERASDVRDDVFYLTPLGIKIWRGEISIEDIEGRF